MSIFICDCGHPESEHSDITRGYGWLDGKTYCYDCCAEGDKRTMRERGKYPLYLTHNKTESYVSNWPGSLKIPCTVKVTKRGHNWGLTRYDCWFVFEGYYWHGVQYGDNTQIVRCKRTKEQIRLSA